MRMLNLGGLARSRAGNPSHRPEPANERVGAVDPGDLVVSATAVCAVFPAGGAQTIVAMVRGRFLASSLESHHISAAQNGFGSGGNARPVLSA